MKKLLLSLVALMAIGVSAWADGVTVPQTRIAATRFSKLKVTLESTNSYRDLQFDLTLPEGITLKNEAGGIVTDAASGHTIAYNAQEGGAIRFVVVDNIIESADQTATSADAATYGKSLSSGIIVEIPINADATFAGTKQATLANMSTSADDGTMVPLTEGTFDIKAVLLGDVDDSGVVNVNDALWIAEFSLGQIETGFVEEAAYVDTNEDINVNDAVRTAEIALGGGASSIKKRTDDNIDMENSELDPD